MSKRDNHTHYQLKNWERYQNEGRAGIIPPKHPKGASWQKQIKDDGRWLDLDAPEPIDEDNAELVQHAMIRCVIHDLKAANILRAYYRDGWEIDEQVVRRARNKFWKWL